MVSPQGWGDIHLSKHHYAIELAKSGNTVYFLDPIKSGSVGSFTCKVSEVEDRLHHVQVTAWLPYGLRFRFPWLFNFLVNHYARKVARKLVASLDIVWCFNVHHFDDLRAFGARLNIFHAVDIFEEANMHSSRHADLILATTDDIAAKFDKTGIPVYKIEHGVSSCFLQYTEKYRKEGDKTYAAGDPINIGYVGNLLMHGIDRQSFICIVEENENVAFHLWGPYELGTSNIAGRRKEIDADTVKFIEQLKNSPNVTLYGIKPPDDIAKHFQEMDGFLICYDLTKEVNKGANSHKILEYLSTGKATVSNRISAYANRPGLVEMLPEDGSVELPDLFKKVVSGLGDYNRKELREQRINFVSKHSYSHQIESIVTIIDKHQLV